MTVVVVGGGASGLAAALSSARKGAKVILLEKGRSLGRKILASGGGRCNLTNRDIRPERYHGGDSAFVKTVLAGFDARSFFQDLGLMLLEEPDGRVFPRCGRSQAVVDVLCSALNELGVDIRLNTEVKKIEKSWDRVILSCGGAAHPQLGGGEGGYALAQSMGHSIAPIRPSLVPLCVKDQWVKKLKGIRIEASLSAGPVKARGEVLFTAYGVSGPAVLDISREAGKDKVSMNLFPEFSEEQLLRLLSKRVAKLGNRSLKGFLTGMLPDKIPLVLLENQGFSAHEKASGLGDAGVKRLCRVMQDWRFGVAGPRPWDEAMVSAGGVDVSEVDASTLESKKMKGLYLTGELLDVDGDSGGYNLHFAWASGVKAGVGAAG